MADVMSAEDRSALMARIRGKDTKPELLVRRLTHRLGYRYRLHRRDLPGSPDLVFPRKRKVIFVHGCFWHHHHGCEHAATPKTRRAFWTRKLKANADRDQRALHELQARGWDALVIWECETKDSKQLADRIVEFMQK